MTNIFFEDRKFQVWRFDVKDGALLVRSPKSPAVGPEPAQTTNVDLVFECIAYVAAPRFLKGLQIVEAMPDEVEGVRSILGERWHDSLTVYILLSRGVRHMVVARNMWQEVHTRAIMDVEFLERVRPCQ